MDGGGLLDWYWELPPVTRWYLTGCTAVTALCALDVLSPFHVYYNYHAIAVGGQLWRLVTNFLFFGGSLGVDFLFHMYFLVRYSRGLEDGYGRGRALDFAFCMLFGGALLMAVAPYTPVLFFGSSLSFMLTYLWGRRNPGMQISLLGLVHFTAPYLPWVLLGFSLLLGHDVTTDALGIAVGHAYFWLEDVWPNLAEARGWRVRKVLPSPSNLLALARLTREACCCCCRRAPAGPAIELDNR